MAKGFIDRSWEVTVFTRNTVPAREQLSWHGAELIEYDYGGTFHKPEVILICGNLDYAAYLKSQKWDVLVFHAYEGSLLCALPHIREIPGRKILVSHGYAALLWEKSPRFPYGLVSVGRRFFRSIAMIRWMRSFDRIVYLSEQADFHGFYDHFLAKATGYKGLRVIPNGIDLSERGDADSGFRLMNGIPEDAFVLLCVANYSPRKDQAYGARAFRKAALPGAVLVFIGSEFNEHSRRFEAVDSENLYREKSSGWRSKAAKPRWTRWRAATPSSSPPTMRHSRSRFSKPCANQSPGSPAKRVASRAWKVGFV
jgi:glycosyltransferase involved in cell wall biosynthesis